MVLNLTRMATQTEAPSTTPSVQVVGNAFVEQYYHILHHSPNMVHKFYQDSSFISRPDEDGTMITVTTMKVRARAPLFGQWGACAFCLPDVGCGTDAVGALQRVASTLFLSLIFGDMELSFGLELHKKAIKPLYDDPINYLELLNDFDKPVRFDASGLKSEGINDKICSLDYTAYKAEIKTADAQESYKDGVIVLVTGCLTRKEDDRRRKFIQSFFLAPQDKGYFVLNDVFRYVDESNPMEDNHVVVEGIDEKQTPPLIAVTSQPFYPMFESRRFQIVATGVNSGQHALAVDPPRAIDSPSPDLVSVHKEETKKIEEEAQDVMENEGPLANENNNSAEPEPFPSENNKPLVVAESISSTPVEDAPKMSYASILSSQTKKGGPMPTKVYVPANTSRITPAKTENIPVATVAQGPPPPEVSAPIASSSISSPDSSNVHDEGDGHSIYIRNLPLNATVPQLETEFNKFGPIKQGGIQVRSNKQLGFCFGFVEFQDFNSMQNAIQSSPVVIGDREAVVEIKRTTTRVGTGRGGRFPPGRGGFRNDGFRGRGGSFNGGRGYGRSDYGGGRGEFSGRGRGPPGGRGDGYHQQGRGRGGRRGGSAQYTAATA
ncbi:hypothetical protein OSB04_000440 [Centaurea solstitialis]|uniref:Uncharacterized protein n=1 Tax=Centaurea solstitialis TaxID=347529 RepID=A0AA38TQV1_9ASTR|nr:hypothetical protein OSB04_000440 [Centaurea solstitialis]